MAVDSSTKAEKDVSVVSQGSVSDIEKGTTEEIKDLPTEAGHDDFKEKKIGVWEKLSGAGVELRGAEPVPVEKRTDTRYVNVFTIFATSMTSLLP